MPRPICATLSRAAFAHNLNIAKSSAGDAKVWAVLKANAYGHGLERAARALEHAEGFAVLDFDEAVRLRALSAKQPILMLEGFFEPADLALVCEHGLTPVIHDRAQVDLLASSKLACPIDAYIKLNSGMNRLGFTVDGVRAAYDKVRGHRQVRTITLMTHFADADGKTGIRPQLERFDAATRGIQAPRSLANSAALLRYPAETRADWVRPGIMLYGCSPFADQSAAALGLKPAMTLTSRIIATQKLAVGERVGYGLSYEARAPVTIGIVACGYADGYPRHAPSGTPVLVNGRRTETVGRVSMDMIAVDLTGITGAGIGAPVTLWGEGLSADEVAAAAGTLSYELLTKVTARVRFVEAA